MSAEDRPLAWPKSDAEDDLRAPGALDRGAASKNRSPAEPAPPSRQAVRAFDFGLPVPAAKLRARVVRDVAEFEALAGAWSSLLAECEDANVFLSHEWLHSWWSAYRPDADLAIVVVDDRGDVRGIAPLMIETVARFGVRARMLRFIGDGTGETDHVNVLTGRRDRHAVLPVLLTAIAALDWDVAEFNQVPEGSATTRELVSWIRGAGLHCAIERSPCPVRRLPSEPAQVLTSLPARLRTSIRSSRKRLQQKHRVEFGQHADERELDSALETFFANHASRWQGKGQAGAFADPRRRDFYARLTPRLLQRGWLRFFFLKLDGRCVAQQYCFALDGTVMLLQEGFDFQYAQDNPGNVLRAHVFEALAASGATCYDFLAGSSRHKRSWSDALVHDLRVHCARRSTRGWLFHALPQHRERLKAVLRPWLARLRRAAGADAAAPPAEPGAP